MDLARTVGPNDDSLWDHEIEKLAILLVQVRNGALEEAAQEAASWWTLFNFDSFAPTDIRRAANPHQIAERIRWLKTQEVGK